MRDFFKGWPRKMDVIQVRRLSVVIVIAATVLGCGTQQAKPPTHETSELQSSGKELPVPTTDSNEDVSANVAVMELPNELHEPISALKPMNAAPNELSRDRKTAALSVSFADLNLKSILNGQSMTEDDVKRLPEQLRSLQGNKLKIRGYMYPTIDEAGINTFFLDRLPRLMNFGADSKIDELVEVHLTEGTIVHSIPYTEPIDVIGVFQIDPLFDEGKIIGLYSLKDAEVVGSKTKSGGR